MARPGSTEPWLAQLREWREQFPLRYGDEGELLKPQPVLEALQELTAGSDVIFTTGVGQHQMWAMQYLLCDRPRTFITSGGLGTMGYGDSGGGRREGCPARRDRRLRRRRRLLPDDLPGAGDVGAGEPPDRHRHRQQRLRSGWCDSGRTCSSTSGSRRCNLTHHLPDYAALAEAYGARGFTVEREDELRPALEEALACGQTAVVDCRVDPREHCFPMIPAGASALELVEFPDGQAVLGPQVPA